MCYACDRLHNGNSTNNDNSSSIDTVNDSPGHCGCSKDPLGGSDVLLKLKVMDVLHVMTHGSPLLASGGEVYDVAWLSQDNHCNRNNDARSRLKTQRQQLLKRIGLEQNNNKTNKNNDNSSRRRRRKRRRVNDRMEHTDKVNTLGSVHRLITEEDIKYTTITTTTTSSSTAATTTKTTTRTPAMSTRLCAANRSRRSRDVVNGQLTYSACHRGVGVAVVDMLLEQLFAAEWIYRHGAALLLSGLLSLIRSDRYRCWLEECAVRCVAVLGLDHFADYSGSSGIVSPVREPVAQMLATGMLLFVVVVVVAIAV